MTSIFERFLSLWVGLCIVAGILLGKIAPGVAQYLDGMAIYVKGAPVVSIPIAIPLFIQTVLIFWLGYGLARPWPPLWAC